jgi:hypothetical protein
MASASEEETPVAYVRVSKPEGKKCACTTCSLTIQDYASNYRSGRFYFNSLPEFKRDKEVWLEITNELLDHIMDHMYSFLRSHNSPPPLQTLCGKFLEDRRYVLDGRVVPKLVCDRIEDNYYTSAHDAALFIDKPPPHASLPLLLLQHLGLWFYIDHKKTDLSSL